MFGASNVEVEKRWYFKQQVGVEEIKGLAAKLPGGARELISTRSTRYKDLGLDIEKISEAEAVELLAKEPKLWRRPIVTDGDRVIIGYNPANLKNLMGVQ